MADGDKWAALREHCESGRVKQRSFTGCHDGESPFAPRAKGLGGSDSQLQPPGSSSSGTPGRRRQRVKALSMPALHEAFAQQESNTTASGRARGGSLGSGGSDRWAALHEHCASGRVKQRSFAGTDHELFRGKGEGDGSSRDFFDLGGTVIREETFESDGDGNAKEGGTTGTASVAPNPSAAPAPASAPAPTPSAAPAPASASTPATADTGCSCVLL
uniref:Uncharacterized protein n=1 Tax=Odontella aurita TaxID=265563 RepID=A0A6U6L923_9STRA|mmetsp:Transcript_7351/g.21696  ORF Transcript_7351/g.21696 Transcript_7351/m.21696 type:complete len:217 (+) Transcript_7351:152-802(+)